MTHSTKRKIKYYFSYGILVVKVITFLFIAIALNSIIENL